MASNDPTVTVQALLARVTSTTSRIQVHRDAMAAVAAEIKATASTDKPKEVSK